MNPHSANNALAETRDLAAVNSFYQEVGYGGALSGDLLLVAQAGQTIIAAVRLCTEHKTLVLRGMYVSEEQRRRGTGSLLLDFVSEKIGLAECWCVPYTHLTEFYSRIGFRVNDSESTPNFLLERKVHHLAKGHLVTVMQRMGQ